MTLADGLPTCCSDLGEHPPTSVPGVLDQKLSSRGASSLPSEPGQLAQSLHQRNQLVSGKDTSRAQQEVGEWDAEITRYGLTSATLDHDPPVALHHQVGSSHSHATASLQSQTRSDGAAPEERPNPLQGKRASEEDAVTVDRTHTPGKRPRLAAPSPINLDAVGQPTSDFISSSTPSVTSPLFFSNSSKQMAARPPSFSSSEAAAMMMRRIPDDQEGNTTIHQLPHGHVSLGSPAGRSSSTSGSGSRFPSTSRSTDAQAVPPAVQHLQGIGVIELLEQDERPTFVIDLANAANFNSGFLDPLFVNAALRASEKFTDLLAVDSSDPVANIEFSRFKAWILSFVKQNESMDVCRPSLSYGDISWTCSTVRQRYRIVSGNLAIVSDTPTSPNRLANASSVLEERARRSTPTRDPHTPRERSHSDADYFGNVDRDLQRRAHSVPPDSVVSTPMSCSEDPFDEMARPSFDWTRIAVTPELPQHIQLARSVDWASTSLGPIEDWPDDLRTMSNLIMGSPHPAALWWGLDLVGIYNEAYTTLAGQKHPKLLGARYRDGWAEIWEDIRPIFDRAWNEGQATMKHDDRLYVIRNGFLEETFFDWSIVPLISGDGSVVGLYNPAFENTRRKVNERRMLTLREIGEQTSLAQDVKSFWGLVQKGLEYNEFDVPFALFYSVAEDFGSEVSSVHSGSMVHPPLVVLEGAIGVPPNHPAAILSLDLRSSHDGFAPYMRRAMTSQGQPIVLRRTEGTLPADLTEGLESRGFGEPSPTVVVVPVHPTTAGDTVVGFIVMGVNPRRPYEEDYDLFIHLLSRQLATSMASIILFEEEIKRGRQAALLAALDRQELSTQLQLRTQEAVESEYKFTRMAEFAPVGIFIANSDGSINYCNDMWWDLSRHSKSSDINTWMQSVRDEDRQGLEDVWDKLVSEKVAVTHEFRFKYSRQADDSHSMDTWVLLSAFPEKDEFGALKRVFGCITDITQQKWAENVQNQRREEAVELKRQQENFIDITSHEMRNPLSAVLQCADEITNSLSVYRDADPASLVPGNMSLVLEGCVEAAHTISLCANHQKRIVDDILTLSKLDSQLLLVTPVEVQPVTVIAKVLRMFEAELNTNDIRGEFHVEKSYKDLDIDWVKLDPSRLRQVLINLMTNAIKFTHTQENRSITISLGASLSVPKANATELSFFESRRADRAFLTDEPEWGTGEKINLYIAVRDTGPGLDAEEKKMLFQRFSQASPRTHVQYGGSGLGLFISRTLAELQGGQIGVASEKGVGSTFAFYVKCRKISANQLSPSTIMPPPPSPFRPLDADQAASPTLHYSTSGRKAPTPNEPRSHRSSISSAAAASPGRDPDAPAPLDVLIVEDNIVNQKVLQRQLRNLGNNTHVANHGMGALDALRRSRFWDPLQRRAASHSSSPSAESASHPGQPPVSPSLSSREDDINISVILMDLEMPVMDGVTCALKIRELEREGVIARHIPIIAVTAYARPEQIANAKAAGIDDVVSKPFQMPELIPKIEELVAKYNTHTISASPTVAAI